MTTLSDFILLGQQSTGSFALSSDKTKVFSTAMGTYLDIICDVFNTQAIPRLIDLNAERFKGFTDYPRMTHGDIEDVDLEALGNFVSRTVGCGALIPDSSMDDYLRQAANMPDRIDDYIPNTPSSEPDDLSNESAETAARDTSKDPGNMESDTGVESEGAE